MKVPTVAAPTTSGIATQSRIWDKRAHSWDHSALPGLHRIADTVLRHAYPVDGLDVVDMGAGSGQLTLELAPYARSVVAVDFSPMMLLRLAQTASRRGLTNIDTVCSSLQSVDLEERSVDVIVSNYAFHHLRHREKAEVLGRAARWLRPGGVIVIGDMMFSVGGGAADRRIIAAKVASIAKRGPAGWWRIAKNVWRFLGARHECPASTDAWESMLRAAGFTGIHSERVVAEGAVVRGHLAKP